jgi:hypothetical protein
MTRNLTILLVFISLFYLDATAKKSATKSSKPWFQKKLFKEIYDQYYIYIYETDYNDRISCPDIEKYATLSAITGTTQYNYKPPFRVIPSVSVSVSPPLSLSPSFQPPKLHYMYILDITVRDILIFIADILISIANMTYYMWQVFIMTVFLTMLITVTILVLVLFFGQY